MSKLSSSVKFLHVNSSIYEFLFNIIDSNVSVNSVYTFSEEGLSKKVILAVET